MEPGGNLKILVVSAYKVARKTRLHWLGIESEILPLVLRNIKDKTIFTAWREV